MALTSQLVRALKLITD